LQRGEQQQLRAAGFTQTLTRLLPQLPLLLPLQLPVLVPVPVPASTSNLNFDFNFDTDTDTDTDDVDGDLRSVRGPMVRPGTRNIAAFKKAGWRLSGTKRRTNARRGDWPFACHGEQRPCRKKTDGPAVPPAAGCALPGRASDGPQAAEPSTTPRWLRDRSVGWG